MAVELGLQGQPQRVTVSVLNGKVDTFETCPIECAIQSLDGTVSQVTVTSQYLLQRK